ncbi:hypothetical protein [Falsirhodobacter xinxiangensis]|uniref:hypothetical protein n=1 Tax=Falsirhodobacter xinxiangensis TaxID=2530049 RepID=UPI0010A9D0E1|nr:hypothetical protein [Rhodobacter xinxiangensis]
MQYFGIYWTHPVPWLGFTTFGDVDHAASVSRTIRYQRDMIRREVKDRRATLVAEAAFIERAPDRGSPEVAAEIAAIVAKRSDLTPMLVDFSAAFGWRSHYHLKQAMDQAKAEFLLPEPLGDFDPVQHFRKWSNRHNSQKVGKEAHRVDILAAVANAPDTRPTPLASYLNDLGLRTHGGRPWTPDNIRHFLKVASP